MNKSILRYNTLEYDFILYTVFCLSINKSFTLDQKMQNRDGRIGGKRQWLNNRHKPHLCALTPTPPFYAYLNFRIETTRY